MEKLKRVVIKQELVELTGDFRPALILNQFIYWTERMFDTDKYIAEERERASKGDIDINMEESKGWIYKTASELSEELMVGMTNSTIGKYIKQLTDAGYITQRRNPKHKWDKTLQYRVDLYKVQKDLGALGYALEGYKLLPKIEILDTEMIEEVENDTSEVEENKKDLSAQTDKPITDTNINKTYTNSICENKENIQDEKKSMEELRKIAKQNILDRNDKFLTYLPSTQDMLIDNELNKISKELGGID